MRLEILAGALVVSAQLLTASATLAAPGGSSDVSIRGTPGRPYGPSTPCGALAGLVARSGAVVISTGPATYDRAVRDGQFCPLEQTTEPLYVAARDTSQCFVGYRCHDRLNDGRGRTD